MKKGRDLGPQILRLKWRGEELELKFSNDSLRIAEDVYDEIYRKSECDWTAILMDLSKGKSGAIMAVYFGALKGRLRDLSWDEFSDNFRLTDIPEVSEQLAKAVDASLPDAEQDGQAEPKNA
ncbi:MAG: hypothetical protein K5663_08510 [Clostridiales bacterium]|nr:hypothetical protein [Clostridiales bacterium]